MAKIGTNASCITCWPNLEPMLVSPPTGILLSWRDNSSFKESIPWVRCASGNVSFQNVLSQLFVWSTKKFVWPIEMFIWSKSFFDQNVLFNQNVCLIKMCTRWSGFSRCSDVAAPPKSWAKMGPWCVHFNIQVAARGTWVLILWRRTNIKKY